MGKKLYVGNLAYSVTSEGLKEIFAPFGTVDSAEVIADKYSGQSKGFGFVEMANDNEAEEAMKNLDGKDHGGRSLKVNEARPKTDRKSGGFGGGGGGGRSGRGGGRGRREW